MLIYLCHWKQIAILFEEVLNSGAKCKPLTDVEQSP